MGRVLLLLLIFPVCLNAQKLRPNKLTNDIYVLKKQTLFIMGKLNIATRSEIKRDGNLQLLINDAMANGVSAAFRYWPISYFNNDSIRQFYPEPVIFLPTFQYNIFYKLKDTTQQGYVSTISGVIHELTHYFSSTPKGKYFVPTNFDEYQVYRHERQEMEAHAVGNYFYLKFQNPKQLKSIIKKAEKDKQELIDFLGIL